MDWLKNTKYIKKRGVIIVNQFENVRSEQVLNRSIKEIFVFFFNSTHISPSLAFGRSEVKKNLSL